MIPKTKKTMDISSMTISPSNTNAVIYARVSTSKQEKGYSLDTQIQGCTDFAERNGLNIISILSETRRAGEMKNQRKLLQILADHSNIQLIAFCMDRFSRNFFDYAMFEKKCNEKKIIFHDALKNRSSNVSSDLKQMTSDIRDAVTEHKTLSRRSSSSFQYRKQHGLYRPTISKYGTKYLRDKNGKFMRIIDDKNEKNIKKLINMFYYGAKCDKINSLLNEITGRNDHCMYNYKEQNAKVYEILRGNMSSSMIADFLNDIKVYRRNRPWSAQSILNLIKSE
jgi:DNA invertase Pin-like site-specific DNA recombinase